MAEGNASSREDGNFETIDTKINKLIHEWATLNVSADGSILQKTETLFKNTARLVLSAVWVDKVNALLKSKLTLILHQCIQTVASACAESKALIEALSELLADPWGNPALRKILSSEEKTEKTSLHDYYCATENPQVLWLRLEVLESTQCEDLAQKLCSCCLHCGPLKGNEKLEIMNVRLLFRSGRMDQLTKEIKNYTCSEGRQLIGRILLSDEPDRFEMSECLSQVLLVRDMVLSSDHESTKDLMNQWIDMHISKGTELSTLRQQVLKLCFLSTTSAPFYLMVDLLHSKFGDSLLQLYVELYIRALTVDINFMENARLTDPKEVVEELESHVADTLCKLAGFLGNHPTLARECILSAFSISPTKDRLDKLYQYVNEETINAGGAPLSSSHADGASCVPCSGECHCHIKGECRKSLHKDSVEMNLEGNCIDKVLPAVSMDTEIKYKLCDVNSDDGEKDVSISDIRHSLGLKLGTSSKDPTRSTDGLSPLQLSPDSVDANLSEELASTHPATSEEVDFSMMISECVVYTENVTTSNPDDPMEQKNGTGVSENTECGQDSDNQNLLNKMTGALSLKHESSSEDSDDEKLDSDIPEDIYTANSHILDYSEEKLPSDLLRDLTIVLDEPRSKILTWDLNWHELESRCKMYLEQRSLGPKLQDCKIEEQEPEQSDNPAVDMDHDDAMIAVAELLVNDLPLNKFSNELLNSVPSVAVIPENSTIEACKSSEDSAVNEDPVIQSPGSESVGKSLPAVQSPEIELVGDVFAEVQCSESVDDTPSDFQSVECVEQNGEEAAEYLKSCPDKNITLPLITNGKLGASNMNPTVVISQADISTARKVLDERSSFLKELLLSSKGPPYDRQAIHASSNMNKLNISPSKTRLNINAHENESQSVLNPRPSTHSLLRASRPFEHSGLPQMTIPVIPVQKVDISGLSALDVPNRTTKPVILNANVPHGHETSLAQSNIPVSPLLAVSNTNGIVSPSKSSSSVSLSAKVTAADFLAASGRPSPSRPHQAHPFLRTAIVSVQKLDLDATVRKLDAHLSASKTPQLKSSKANTTLCSSQNSLAAKKCELVGRENAVSVNVKSSSSARPQARQYNDKINSPQNCRVLLKPVSLPPSVQKVTVLGDKISPLKAEKLLNDKVLLLQNEKTILTNLHSSPKPNILKRSEVRAAPLLRITQVNQRTFPETIAQPCISTVQYSTVCTTPTVQSSITTNAQQESNAINFIPSVLPSTTVGSTNSHQATGETAKYSQEKSKVVSEDSSVSQNAVVCTEATTLTDPSTGDVSVKTSDASQSHLCTLNDSPTHLNISSTSTNNASKMQNHCASISCVTPSPSAALSSESLLPQANIIQPLPDSSHCHEIFTSPELASHQLESAPPKHMVSIGEVVNMLVQSNMSDAITVLAGCSGSELIPEEPSLHKSELNDMFWLGVEAPSGEPSAVQLGTCLTTSASDTPTTVTATCGNEAFDTLAASQLSPSDSNARLCIDECTQPQMDVAQLEGLAASMLPVANSCRSILSTDSSSITLMNHDASRTENLSLHQVVSLPDLDACQMSLLEQIGDTQDMDSNVVEDTLVKLNAYQDTSTTLTHIESSHVDVLTEPCAQVPVSVPMDSVVCQTAAVAVEKKSPDVGMELDKSVMQHNIVLPVLKCNQVLSPLPPTLRTYSVTPSRLDIIPPVRMTAAIQPSIALNNGQQETSVIRSAVGCSESQLLCATTGIGPPPVNAVKMPDGNNFILMPSLNSLSTSSQREPSVVVDCKMQHAVQGAQGCNRTSAETFTITNMTANDVISKVVMHEFRDVPGETSMMPVNNTVIVSSSQSSARASPVILSGSLQQLPNGTLVPTCSSHSEVSKAEEKCAISPLKIPTNDFETTYKRFLLGGKPKRPSKFCSTSLPASPVTSATSNSSLASTFALTTVSSVTANPELNNLVIPTSASTSTSVQPVYTKPKMGLSNIHATVKNVTIPPRVSSAPPRATSPLLQTLVSTATQVWEGCEQSDKKGRSLLFPSKADRRKWVLVRNQHGGTECKKVNVQSIDCANGTSIPEPQLPLPRNSKPRFTGVSTYACQTKGVVLPPFSNFTATSGQQLVGLSQAAAPVMSIQNSAQTPRSEVTVTSSIRAPRCSTMAEMRYEEPLPSTITFHGIDNRTHTVMSTTNAVHPTTKVKPVVLPTPKDYTKVDAKTLVSGDGLLLENVVSGSTVQRSSVVFTSKEQRCLPKPCAPQKEKKKVKNKKPIKTSPADLQKIYEENPNVAKILENYQQEVKKNSAATAGTASGTNAKAKSSKQSLVNSFATKSTSARVPPPSVSSPKPREVSPSSISSSSSSVNSSPIAALPAMYMTQVLPPVSSLLTRLSPHSLVVNLPIPKQAPSQSQTIKRHYLPPDNLETPTTESVQQEEPKKKKPAPKKEMKKQEEKKVKSPPKKDKPDSPKLACPMCDKKMCSAFSVKRHLKSVHKSTGEPVIETVSPASSSSPDIKTNLVQSSNSPRCGTMEPSVCASSSVADLGEPHQLKTVNLTENVASVTDLCINKKLNSPPRPSDLDNIDLDTLLSADFDYPTSGFNLFGDPIAEDGLERNGSDEAKEEEDISRAFGLFCDPPREQSALDGELSDTPFTLFSDPEMPSNMPPGCSPVGDVSRPECLSPIEPCRRMSTEDGPSTELYVEPNKLHSNSNSDEPVSTPLQQPDSSAAVPPWTKDRDADTSSVECEQLQEGIAAAAKNRTRARKTNAPCRCCDNDSSANILNKKCRKDTKVAKPARTATRNRTKESRRSSVRTNRR